MERTQCLFSVFISAINYIQKYQTSLIIYVVWFLLIIMQPLQYLLIKDYVT